MKNSIRIISICAILIIALSISLNAEDNEKSKMLSSSFFGNWTNAKKIKKSGKITLQVWAPYIDYTKTIPDSSLKNVMLQNNNKINIAFNEIWVLEINDGFTPAEKKKFKGQFDIQKVYWKNNKIQAITLEKYYIYNPVTKKKVGKHKITQVWDRDSALNELSK